MFEKESSAITHLSILVWQQHVTCATVTSARSHVQQLQVQIKQLGLKHAETQQLHASKTQRLFKQLIQTGSEMKTNFQMECADCKIGKC